MMEEWNCNRASNSLSIPIFHHSIIPPTRSPRTVRESCRTRTFVGDGTGDAVEELRAHLWVLAQHLDRFLL